MTDNNAGLSVKIRQRPTWMRWLDVLLRAAHVLVISGVFGGALFRIPVTQTLIWRILAVASGAALIASEVVHERAWPVQVRGVMVYVHVGLFCIVIIKPDLAMACLAAALVVGMVGSHMPKKLRYWSLVRRQ